MGTANQLSRNTKASYLRSCKSVHPIEASLQHPAKKRRVAVLTALPAAAASSASPLDLALPGFSSASVAAAATDMCATATKMTGSTAPSAVVPMVIPSQHDIIRELNHRGVYLFNKGDYENAWTFFHQALQYQHLGRSFPVAFDQVAPSFKRREQGSSGERKSVSSQVNTTTSSSSSTFTPSTPSSPSASSYIFQRMDFDEGMNIYTYVLELKVDSAGVAALVTQQDAVDATLLFNLAQTSRKLDQTDFALSMYQHALKALLPSWSLQTVAAAANAKPLTTGTGITTHLHSPWAYILVPLLHNLGQLAYYQKQVPKHKQRSHAENKSVCQHLNLSMVYYQTALSYCQSNDLSKAMTLNCLGVLYYHRCSSNYSNGMVVGSADENEENELITTQAMNCFQQALQLFSHRSSVAISIAMATTLNNIGRVMVQREDYPAALNYYQRALRIRRALLGPHHIDTAATAFNAGQSLHHLRQFDAALELYHEFWRVAQMVLHSNHRDIAIVLSAMAQIHQERKEYDQAYALYNKSLTIGRAALGNQHSEVAMLLNRLGNFYFEQAEYTKALKAYKEGLAIERKVLDKTHPNIIVTLSNIGEIYRQQEKYHSAIRLYSQAMALQKVRYGEVSSEVAGALNVIGLIHDQMGDTHSAVKVLQEALVMRRTILGDDHLDVSVTLTYLGTILYRRNIVTTALQLFTESLRIRQSKLGPDHRDVAFTLYNVGLCHQLQGNSAEAVVCFVETLRVETLVLGENHKDVTLTLFKLGEAYKADGDLKAALESFQRALRIERRLWQDSLSAATSESGNAADPASMARTLNEIGNVYMAQGHVDEMMDAYIESARLFRRAGLSIYSVHVSPALKLYAAGFHLSAAAA